jgi:hypothetical protein
MEAIAAVILTRLGGRLVLRCRALGRGTIRSGEPNHESQKDGADWGKTIHFDLPGEPGTRLASGFSAASAKLKPSIAVGRNEARVGLVPTAPMTQWKRLKTLSFQ